MMHSSNSIKFAKVLLIAIGMLSISGLYSLYHIKGIYQDDRGWSKFEHEGRSQLTFRYIQSTFLILVALFVNFLFWYVLITEVIIKHIF